MLPEPKTALAKRLWPLIEAARKEREDRERIPEGSMRVGPGTDAVVWRTCPTHKAQA